MTEEEIRERFRASREPGNDQRGDIEAGQKLLTILDREREAMNVREVTWCDRMRAAQARTDDLARRLAVVSARADAETIRAEHGATARTDRDLAFVLAARGSGPIGWVTDEERLAWARSVIADVDRRTPCRQCGGREWLCSSYSRTTARIRLACLHIAAYERGRLFAGGGWRAMNAADDREVIWMGRLNEADARTDRMRSERDEARIERDEARAAFARLEEAARAVLADHPGERNPRTIKRRQALVAALSTLKTGR